MIKKIAVLPNTTKNIASPKGIKLFQTLISTGVSVVLPENTKHELPEIAAICGINFLPENDLFDSSDLIMVLGGDGSMLDAARNYAHLSIPFTGINFGTVGYLSEIDPEEPELIHKIISGEYTIETRMMLDITVCNDIQKHFSALNEVALSNGPITRLMDIHLLCGGVTAEFCRANGLVVATPTGSTGYSLSAGGPVVDPKLNCFCITPVCPHLLRNRPFLLNGDAVIELDRISCIGNTVYLSCDGRDVIELSTNSKILIQRSETTTQILRVRNDGFLGVLNRKMWKSN